MARGLVGEPQDVPDRPVRPEHEQTVVRRLRPVAAPPEVLDLRLEDERAAGGEFFDEGVGAHLQMKDLRRDDRTRPVVQVVGERQCVFRSGQRRDDRVAILDGHGLHDPEARPLGVLLDDAGLAEEPDVIGGRAVAGRKFRPAQFRVEVVNPQASEGRQQMLRRLDVRLAVGQRRPLEPPGNRLDRGRHRRRRPEVRAREHEARVRGGRLQAQVDRLPREEAAPFDLGLQRDGSLTPAHVEPFRSLASRRTSTAFSRSRTSSMCSRAA